MPFAPLAQPHKLILAKDGSGIPGYKDTPIQPWSGFHVHDPDCPAPTPSRRTRPSPPPVAGAPSDATRDSSTARIIAQWVPAPDWKIEDGVLIAGNAFLTTRESFGDCQFHVEWAAPDPPQGDYMNHGNSGVLMLGLFEIQIFDTYTTKLYPDWPGRIGLRPDPAAGQRLAQAGAVAKLRHHRHGGPVLQRRTAR